MCVFVCCKDTQEQWPLDDHELENYFLLIMSKLELKGRRFTKVRATSSSLRLFQEPGEFPTFPAFSMVATSGTYNLSIINTS